MKSLKYLTLLLMLVVFVGCDDDDDVFRDVTPPEAPRNLTLARTGDHEVHLTWDENTESDLAFYVVYYSDSYTGKYEQIATTENNYFIDSGIDNGVKYFYGVTAVDKYNNESELSKEEVYGIGRPEGHNQVIKDYLKFPDLAGFNFGEFKVVPYNAQECDLFFENFNDTFYVNVWDDTEIQDMGPTVDIYDIQYAPNGGWVLKANPNDNVKYLEAKVGHTYVIWTFDGFYAKVRINQITQTNMEFDWAFQTIKGEKLLKQEKHRGKRDKIYKEIIKKR